MTAPGSPIAILFALAIEARPLLRLLSNRRKLSEEAYAGDIGEKSVSVRISGMGPRFAREAAEKLFVAEDPSMLIAAGFAGALSPNLHPGDLVAAESVLTFSAGRDLTYSSDPTLCEAARRTNVLTGRLLTTERIIASQEEKAELAERTGCLAVDMESGAAAEVAARRGVPFIAIRSISDGAADVLPSGLMNSVDQKGSIRIGHLCANLLKNPTLLADALRLSARSSLASRNLAEFLQQFVLRL